MIDINTKFVTLIGTPLGQSFAARMQNAAYNAEGINLQYFYTETDQTHLREILDGIRHMPSFCGCAVTKPNKVAVLSYLDELDPLCAKMGACNTVAKTGDGRLVGYNTDGYGFYRAVDEAQIPISGATVFCFGAGGAGRAICSSLAFHGVRRIYITDVYESNSIALTNDICSQFDPVALLVETGEYSAIRECDIVINATGVGMGSSIGQSPMPMEYILPHQIYFDACYNPEKTRFLQNAEEKGCRIMNGLSMSLYQGVAQAELWTGKSPVNAMRQELVKIIAEGVCESPPVITETEGAE